MIVLLEDLPFSLINRFCIDVIEKRNDWFSCNNNYDITFETLLNECNEVTIHVKNLHTLLTEVYKYINRLSPPLMEELFETRTLYYNLRNVRAIQTYRKNTIAFGIETVTYKSSQLWQILPTELKSIEELKSIAAS